MRVPVAVARQGVWLGSLAITGLNPPFRLQRLAYEMSSLAVRPAAGSSHETRTVAGVRCELVTARGATSDRILVHLHGGGFCIGSARGHRSFASWLSRATGCTVVLPDYRLAPEHPYPAGHDDAEAVWRELASWPAVALSGDSAGAHLALTTALRMRDSGGPMPDSLVLISPVVELGRDRRRDRDLIRRDVLLRPGWEDRCLAALFAGADPPPETRLLGADLRGLPPTMVVAGTDELLLPDADDFSRLAREAGTRIVDIRADGLWHDYPAQAGLIAAADDAVARIADFVAESRGKTTAV